MQKAEGETGLELVAMSAAVCTVCSVQSTGQRGIEIAQGRGEEVELVSGSRGLKFRFQFGYLSDRMV